jgi:ribonuclease P protein component
LTRGNLTVLCHPEPFGMSSWSKAYQRIDCVIIKFMALPKNFRLKKEKNFDKVKRQGQIIHSPLFAVSILTGQKKGPKFGLVVSKKIDKKATERNKIRRWLSEAVRSLLPQLRLDIYAVFFVKKQIKQSNYQKIKDEIKKIDLLFKRN